MAENMNYTIVKGSDALPGTYREYIGIADDGSSMPTDCGDFSLFFDVATNNVYYFMQGTWSSVGSSDSGGGGSDDTIST